MNDYGQIDRGIAAILATHLVEKFETTQRDAATFVEWFLHNTTLRPKNFRSLDAYIWQLKEAVTKLFRDNRRNPNITMRDIIADQLGYYNKIFAEGKVFDLATNIPFHDIHPDNCKFILHAVRDKLVAQMTATVCQYTGNEQTFPIPEVSIHVPISLWDEIKTRIPFLIKIFGPPKTEKKIVREASSLKLRPLVRFPRVHLPANQSGIELVEARHDESRPNQSYPAALAPRHGEITRNTAPPNRA